MTYFTVRMTYYYLSDTTVVETVRKSCLAMYSTISSIIKPPLHTFKRSVHVKISEGSRQEKRIVHMLMPMILTYLEEIQKTSKLWSHSSFALFTVTSSDFQKDIRSNEETRSRRTYQNICQAQGNIRPIPYKLE